MTKKTIRRRRRDLIKEAATTSRSRSAMAAAIANQFWKMNDLLRGWQKGKATSAIP